MLFDVDLSRISRHINAIYNSKELEPKGTLAENAIVQKEGTCPLPEKGTKKKLFLSTFLDKYHSIEKACTMMEVSKSGFYKWKCRSPEDKIPDREKAMALITKVHEDHGSHGYRWVAAYMRINGIATYSDSFVFKAWKHLGFKAKTKHQHGKRRVAKKKDPFPNLIFSTWDLVDRPRQVIVSDMTSFVVWWTYYELTLYFDVFTKQILAWHLAGRRGDRLQYITGLEDVLDLLGTEGVSEPVILHTDQGSVYSSMAYNELIHDSVILRSMSRVGTPGDNPVNESLNGWIKEELFMDFHINDCRDRDDVIAVIERYVDYYNSKRPSWALDYDTPDSYYKRFMNGEIEHKETFSNRVLSEIPKSRKKKKESTFENANVLVNRSCNSSSHF